MKRKYFYTSSVILTVLVSLILLSCSGSEKPVLSVYNWGDYIDESIIADFEKETGCKVVYSLYSSNEEMYVKLNQGADSYDLACPSDYMVERMIKEGMLAKLEYSALPNSSLIDKRFMDLPFDGKNIYSLPYMWGTLGILYNSETVSEPVDSWSLLWSDKYAGRIGMYNSARDSLVPALKLLGYSVNTTDESQLAEAQQLLIDQKDKVLVYGEDNLKEMVSGGELDMALVYSGDYGWVIEDFPNLNYAVPSEGSNIWFDNWVILENSENKELAHQFLNFLCREDIAKRNAEYIGYASPLPSVVAQLDEETRNDPAIYPPSAVIDNCEVFTDLGDFNQVLDRIWTEVKAAK